MRNVAKIALPANQLRTYTYKRKKERERERERERKYERSEFIWIERVEALRRQSSVLTRNVGQPELVWPPCQDAGQWQVKHGSSPTPRGFQNAGPTARAEGIFVSASGGKISDSLSRVGEKTRG